MMQDLLDKGCMDKGGCGLREGKDKRGKRGGHRKGAAWPPNLMRGSSNPPRIGRVTRLVNGHKYIVVAFTLAEIDKSLLRVAKQ